MGCDIHSYAEKRNERGIWEAIPGLHPFDWRSYGMFGWLADMRNYSGLQPISTPRGLPTPVSETVAEGADHWAGDAHSHSWLSLDELLAVDYDAPIEDRRVTRQVGPHAWNGGCTCAPGEGETMPLRQFLGRAFFDDLEKLRAAGAERIVFWFDN